MQRLGRRGRRYSGHRVVIAPDDDNCFTRVAGHGVNESSVGKSLFGLPGWLRDVRHIGLSDCYILDMANAHPTIQHRRHHHL